MQRARRGAFSGRDAKPALAGLLALLLVLAANFSVNHSLHQLLHIDGNGTHHLCLVCAFAKGQVSAVQLAQAAEPVALLGIFALGFFAVPFLSSFDFRLSPSRAPPGA